MRGLPRTVCSVVLGCVILFVAMLVSFLLDVMRLTADETSDAWMIYSKL